jgi:hypothetical protein
VTLNLLVSDCVLTSRRYIKIDVSGVIKLENLSFVGASAGLKWLSRHVVDRSVERIINLAV